MPAPRPNLPKIVSQLAAHYGQPEPPITTDPFELILLENVAYLVSDERREQAFKTLRRHAGEVLGQAYKRAVEQAAAETGLAEEVFPSECSMSLEEVLAQEKLS